MNSPEIRWIQLFDNFKRAYAQLRKAAVIAGEWKLTELERQGLGSFEGQAIVLPNSRNSESPTQDPAWQFAQLPSSFILFTVIRH